MLKRYKYRIYPSDIQKDFLHATFGCCRFVWNMFLQEQKRTYEYKKKFVFQHEMSALLTEVKKLEGYEFLKDVPSTSLQTITRQQDRAMKDFIKKTKGFPKMKKKAHNQSLELTRNQFSVKNGKLKLAKLKDSIKIKWSRELPSEASSCTILKTNTNQYYVSFVADVPEVVKDVVSNSIGIDLGIETFLTISDGRKIKSPNYKRLLDKQKKLQRRLSRKNKGSKNRDKARLCLAKNHEKISNIRKDFINKVVSLLVRENQAISIETLDIQKMLKNKYLARLISLQGWYVFKLALKAKAQEYQRIIYEVGTFVPTSQICSECGFRWGKLALSIRSIECSQCHVSHDRDINASKNVLNEYLNYQQTAGHAAASTTSVDATSSA